MENRINEILYRNIRQNYKRCCLSKNLWISKNFPYMISKAKSIKDRLNYIKIKNPSHQKRKLKAEGPIEKEVFVTCVIDKELAGLLF